MASSKDYLDFILEQLSQLDDITYRAMMGEYIIYYRGKVVGGIYDDRFLVKPVKSAVKMMPEAGLELPYEGAKEMLLVDNVENKEFLRNLLEAMYEELPAPEEKEVSYSKEKRKLIAQIPFVGVIKMNYKIIDKEKYYRKGVFRHFSEDCKCSTSMTARIDVTYLVEYSKRNGTKFYINFLYILSKVLNSREDYRMGYLWQTDELICYDVINPTQYVFHEDTETCTPVYTEYFEEYKKFYTGALNDVEEAKKTREYGLDMANHPNWFDASYISWLSYDSLNIELPDGHLFFAPIINWGKYREENGRLVMPVTVRLNHAIADGYLVANVFRLLEKEINSFVES